VTGLGYSTKSPNPFMYAQDASIAVLCSSIAPIPTNTGKVPRITGGIVCRCLMVTEQPIQRVFAPFG